MLAFIASRLPVPAEESAVRDPGFLTLAFAVAQKLRRESAVVFSRHLALMAKAGGPNPV